MRENIKVFSYVIVLFLVLVSCGCIALSPSILEKNQSQFADQIRASQTYYDNLVRDDQLNATAWCIWGNYYNNAFSQYDTALQSYSLELDPEYGYAWFSKGVTLQNMKHYNDAKLYYEKALLYDPSLGRAMRKGKIKTGG